ncbi:hypothetical protein PFY01_15215 [Brevundimonas vesicularis]|uniref:hypothetical protein n=1 Tax=Brevundimonas vesicularis TaxID=41276 RepID=UPI0022EC6D09|nr:hypothetical protein [Brevundimonas vesicularis]WBT06039.1 hypothetical protein PFY01_15215 [Brevundimonas vesicularis]
MRNDQRQFQVYDLEIAVTKKGASVPNMQAVMDAWQRRYAAGQLHSIRGRTATLVIGGINVDQAAQTATILVRLSDQMAPNSVYSNPAMGGFNEHLKAAQEGADFGCHVLLSTAPEAGSPNVYTCAVEKVTGLAASLVQRMLSKLLHYEYRQNPSFYQYPHPGGGRDAAGNPRVERCRPHIEMRGRPSETLIDDINRGQLTGVSLVKAEQVAPIAGAAFLSKKKTELQLSIDHNNMPANLWNGLVTALRRNSQAYDSAKVSYKVPGVSRTVTVELDASTGQPLADLYVEAFEISNLRPILAQSSRTIVPHLVQAAMPQVIARRTI